MSHPSDPVYILSEMTLAMEAIGVPKPPMFTPASSDCQSEVNPDSITAAGTLLTTWLMSADDVTGSHDIRPFRTASTDSERAMFPVNTKRNTKVRMSPQSSFARTFGRSNATMPITAIITGMYGATLRTEAMHSANRMVMTHANLASILPRGTSDVHDMLPPPVRSMRRIRTTVPTATSGAVTARKSASEAS